MPKSPLYEGALSALEPLIGFDLAIRVIELRNSKGRSKKFDAYRASLTADVFRISSDPKRAALEYLLRDKNRKDVSQEYIKTVLLYDDETGIFRSALHMGKRPEGEILGSLGSHGYLSIFLAGKSYLCHRLAWLYCHGVWPDDQLDHIDRNRTNNRLSNLRECTHQQNSYNKGMSLQNSSGRRGVFFCSTKNRWAANISSKRIGRYFKTKEEAIACREAAEAEKFQEFMGDVT